MTFFATIRRDKSTARREPWDVVTFCDALCDAVRATNADEADQLSARLEQAVPDGADLSRVWYGIARTVLTNDEDGVLVRCAPEHRPYVALVVALHERAIAGKIPLAKDWARVDRHLPELSYGQQFRHNPDLAAMDVVLATDTASFSYIEDKQLALGACLWENYARLQVTRHIDPESLSDLQRAALEADTARKLAPHLIALITAAAPVPALQP
ncbi:MAG: hypothetical protein ABL907_08895 [Hyphomicrobium sp.]